MENFPFYSRFSLFYYKVYAFVSKERDVLVEQSFFSFYFTLIMNV